MEERAKIRVGLPRQTTTTSYWQDTADEIADLRSTASLPDWADYVIVGSGISGASIAYNLLQRKPGASIVMLEARQACSGATGRNGGHTKAASYRSFLEHESRYGLDEAIKIARMEYANIRETHDFARSHNIDCAAHACQTVDILYSDTHLAAGLKAVARMQETMGLDDPAAAYEVFSAEEASQRFLTPGALGAFRYPAGSINAYKFTTGILKLCLQSGLNLQTRTPVLFLSRKSHDSDPAIWELSTTRGKIQTRHPILATNGYTARLLPQFQGTIVPLRGQVSAQRSGTGLPQTGLTETYSFIYDTGYEYMITRPLHPKSSSDLFSSLPSQSPTAAPPAPSQQHPARPLPDAGTMIIGGGIGTLPLSGVSEYGTVADDELNPQISDYLTTCTERYFGEHWGNDSEDGRVIREWTGIMGTSCDGLPYVGRVPETSTHQEGHAVNKASDRAVFDVIEVGSSVGGPWICASFNGHGMVLCLKCAEAVVEMIVEEEQESSADGETGLATRGRGWRAWFPDAMVMRAGRLGQKFTGRLGMTAPGEAEFAHDRLGCGTL